MIGYRYKIVNTIRIPSITIVDLFRVTRPAICNKDFIRARNDSYAFILAG